MYTVANYLLGLVTKSVTKSVTILIKSTHMEQHSFGVWLKLKRKGLDLTREELAERAGYSAATIRKTEDEERRPSEQIVERLAEIFKIPKNERESFLRFARDGSKFSPAQIDENLPWRVSGQSPRSNIPATTTSLIAREKEIALVGEHLSKNDIRLVTLMGSPGIGKTRLSIEAAREALSDFPDGVFFVALALLDDPHSIPSAIIQALGYLESGDSAPEDQLKESIGQKQMLIVLDNCEHLIEEIASIVSRLLSTCPYLKMLATSRESFRIPGEWQYLVPAFDLPKELETIDLDSASAFPALMLFVERARAVQSDFKLTAENVQTIVAICSRLDGLPLVIELIAARMRIMSPQALLERLSGPFVLTADGMRAASERQKTLKNAIEWSYNLLSEQEQKLFVYLSAFSGGFTLADAEAVFAHTVTEKSVPELLTLLLDKSLIRRVANELHEDRYEMLVTIQEYALARLRGSGAEAEIRDRHLAHFLALAEKADQELRGPNQLKWLKRLNSERDNLRAALTWVIETRQTKLALQLVRRLDWFWNSVSEHTEGRYWLERGLRMPGTPSEPVAHAEMLVQLAHHIFLQVGEHQQRPYIDQALLIARKHKDKHNIARALSMLGLDLTDEHNYSAAQSAFLESAVLFEEVQDEWGHAHAFMCLGHKFSSEDDLPNALSWFEQALLVCRKTGDRFLENVILRGIAITCLKQNNLSSALAALRESLLLAHQVDSKLEIAATLSRLGNMAQRAGNPARAVTLYWVAKKLFDLVGAQAQRFEFDLNQALAPCRAELSKTAFAEAVERGRTMTMEQAIAFALE